MMVLSPEQRLEIGKAGNHPVPIIDPETHQAYLIIDLQPQGTGRGSYVDDSG